MGEDTGFNLSVYAKTDVGRVRSGNEDNFLVLNLSTADTWTPQIVEGDPPAEITGFQQGHFGTVLAVSDGMGGALAGEIASSLAVESVRDRLLELQSSRAFTRFAFEERLRLAVEVANYHIHTESLSHPEWSGMGATFTAAALLGTKAYFAQIGDSRAYLIRGGQVRQMTRDQSLVGQLVESGHITEEEAEQHAYKNVILQALGAAEHIAVEVTGVQLCDGDVLLLCSDGLSNKVRAEEMVELVSKTPTPGAACEALTNLANQRGGEDNITTIVAVVTAAPLAACEEDPVESWVVESIPRDPALPHEIDQALLANEDDTLPT